MRHENIDCVIVRENTEGEYNGLEHEVRDCTPSHLIQMIAEGLSATERWRVRGRVVVHANET